MPKTHADLWIERREYPERIVFIEYRHRKPFSVMTEMHWDHTGKPWFVAGKDRPTGISMRHYDFEWCRRDRQLYYDQSGSGGDIQVVVHRFCESSPPPGEIWVAEGVPIVRYSGRIVDKTLREIPIKNDAELLRMGYRRLKQPRLFNGSRNPFDSAEEDQTVYCKACDDRLPTGSTNRPCDHLEWCDDCGDWIYSDSRQNHDDEKYICQHVEEPEESHA